MGERILFVDDEQNILNAIKRQLANKFQLDLANSPQQGLEAIKKNGSYAVVISDFRMPDMNGVEFLKRVREISPDTIRMMLTGNTDLSTAVTAVNEGSVFRFMTKPCEESALINALKAGLHQYRLVTAEKELLEKTLKGGIEVLTDLLSMANPEAFGRSLRTSYIIAEIAEKLRVQDKWKLETAAMLSQIGLFLLSSNTLRKLYAGKDLTPDEMKTLDLNPMISADLINNIPRLEDVAQIILFQNKHFDGSGKPDDDLKEREIPLGSRILKVALDFDLLEAKGITRSRALEKMKSRVGVYDPEILITLEMAVGNAKNSQVRELMVSELEPNMILEQDVLSTKGQLLISKRSEINAAALKRLKLFVENSGIQEPIRVLVSA